MYAKINGCNKERLGGTVMMREKEYRNIKTVLMVVADIAIIHLGYLLAFLFRYQFTFPEYNFSAYKAMIPFITIFVPVIFGMYGLLDDIRKTMEEHIRSIVVSVLMVNVMTMAGTFFMRTFSFPRTVFAIAVILQAVLMSALYSLLVHIDLKQGPRQKGIVFGSETQAFSVAKKLILKNGTWMSELFLADPEYLDKKEDLIQHADLAVICSSTSSEAREGIIKACHEQGVRCLLMPNASDILQSNSETVIMDDLTLFGLSDFKMSLDQRVMKRLSDIVLSMLLLIVFSPFFLVAYIGIKLTSPGPALFIQKRVTQGGRVFNIYKFRSMVVNAEKKSGPVLAKMHDDRITPFGKFIRHVRIDELPQLYNVLKGDMSLVGPRPERPEFVDQFEKQIPEYSLRHNVKAGITGYAQVHGKYSTNVVDKLRLDLMYIHSYTFWSDLILVFQTILTVVTKVKASGVDDSHGFDEVAKVFGYSVGREDEYIKISK